MSLYEDSDLIDTSLVNLDVPLLLRLDVMAEYVIVFDVCNNIPSSKTYPRKVPLIIKLGYIYISWPEHILYMTSELTKVRRDLFHLALERIFSIMKRANDPESDPEGTPETFKLLKEMTSPFDIC